MRNERTMRHLKFSREPVLREHVTPKLVCPYCHANLDRSSGVWHEQKPSAGDCTICIKCRKVSMFIEDKDKMEYRLRKPNADEIELILKDPEIIRLQMIMATLPDKT